MKKVISLLLCITMCFMLLGCGHPKTIDGVKYDTVGLFTEENPDVHYEVSIGNVVWSIILIETIFAPVYFVGWSIKNPICKKSEYTPGVGCKGK